MCKKSGKTVENLLVHCKAGKRVKASMVHYFEYCLGDTPNGYEVTGYLDKSGCGPLQRGRLEACSYRYDVVLMDETKCMKLGQFVRRQWRSLIPWC